jgi:hypothetical protein
VNRRAVTIVLRDQLVYVMAGRAFELLETNGFAFETRVLAFTITMTLVAHFCLRRSIFERVEIHMHCMAGRAGQIIVCMDTVTPVDREVPHFRISVTSGTNLGVAASIRQLATGNMHRVATPARDLIVGMHAARPVDPRRINVVPAVAVEAGTRCHTGAKSRLMFSMYGVAVGTGRYLSVRHIVPRKINKSTIVFVVTFEAELGLHRRRRMTVSPVRDHRRSAVADHGQRDMDAARSVAGLAFVLGERRIRVSAITMWRFLYQSHLLFEMTEEAPLCSSFGVLGARGRLAPVLLHGIRRGMQRVAGRAAGTLEIDRV